MYYDDVINIFIFKQVFIITKMAPMLSIIDGFFFCSLMVLMGVSLTNISVLVHWCQNKYISILNHESWIFYTVNNASFSSYLIICCTHNSYDHNYAKIIFFHPYKRGKVFCNPWEESIIFICYLQSPPLTHN